jgi:hypothetical protein
MFQAVEASRFSLDSRLTDGGEVVSLTHRKIPGTHFCQRLNRLQGQSAAGMIKSIEKSSDLTGNETRDLPTFNSASTNYWNHEHKGTSNDYTKVF